MRHYTCHPQLWALKALLWSHPVLPAFLLKQAPGAIQGGAPNALGVFGVYRGAASQHQSFFASILKAGITAKSPQLLSEFMD